MTCKYKNIIRKVVYGILFLLMIIAFVYLSEKYAINDEEEMVSISNYYSELGSDDIFVVMRGNELISKLQSGKSLILIGSSSSIYSQKYILELKNVAEVLNVDVIYYYDLNNDKSQKNSNYYKIRELLKGYLTTTDGSENNLLAPSFYIVDDGDVKYYNTDTVAMKNTDSPSDYWDEEKKEEFLQEIGEAINKYYLN